MITEPLKQYYTLMNVQPAKDLGHASAMSVSWMSKKRTKGEHWAVATILRNPWRTETLAPVRQKLCDVIFSGTRAYHWSEGIVKLGSNYDKFIFCILSQVVLQLGAIFPSELFAFGQFSKVNTVKFKSLWLWVSPFQDLKQWRFLSQASAEVRLVSIILETTLFL